MSIAADATTSPATRPADDLARHDFLYAGEAKTRDIYIVRKGQIAWEFHDPAGKGEISDAVRLSNGNVLYAHQFGVTLIDAEKEVLWNFDAPPKCEIHTALPIGHDRALFIINGPTPKVVVMNIVSVKTEREFPLQVKNPNSTHGQFRHARLTAEGTLLVAHMDLRRVVEYDETGGTVWSLDVPGGCWSASRLANGNTLVCGDRNVTEFDPAGHAMWSFAPADVPDQTIAQFQIATRLPDGNTLVNNWVNAWSTKIDPTTAPVQALEVTPDKHLAWVLRSWMPPAALGAATTIQLLDDGSAPEHVHFGAIH